MAWPARVDMGAAGAPSRGERRILLALMALGLAVRIAIVIVDRRHGLAGDEVTYDRYGRFAAQGRWLWATEPYGIPHASFWKMPLYPLLVGAAYSLGLQHHGLELAQSLLGPLTIGLTWLLGRRLTGSPRVALAAAAIIVVYPFAWQFGLRLFPEALAAPLLLVLFIAGLDRPPSVRRGVAVGLLAGVATLTRPNAFVFLGAILLGWLVAAPRAALTAGAVAVACTVLVLVPNALRNHHLSGYWNPLSVQDGAVYGTFNDTAARDPRRPWAWRAYVPEVRPILLGTRRYNDGEVEARLRKLGTDYIAAHPSSLVKAFYWNGLRRAWDLRSPGEVMGDNQYSGQRRSATLAGLIMYWIMLPLALLGLWRLRRRRALVFALGAIFLANSVVETTAAATRYRAPLEPLIVVLAATAVLAPARLRDAPA